MTYNLKGGIDQDGKQYYGRVRILFINEYIHHPKFNRTENMATVCNEIRKVFSEHLKFKVDEPIVNPVAEEMIAHFEENIDYFGCAIIFIFSHGQQDFILCSDYNEANESGKINVWDNFYHHFSGHNKPELHNCPKVFFNEWCQVRGNGSSEKPMEISSSYLNTAHWLIFNAAQPRYKNYINSISALSFCRRLKESAETHDLLDILTMVIDDVGKVVDKYGVYLQPLISSSLHKKLYLRQENMEDYEKNLETDYRSNFEHVAVLGSGYFGIVFKAQHLLNKLEYAVKRIQLRENTEVEQKRIVGQITTLATFTEEYFVRYLRVWYESVDFQFQAKKDSNQNITGLVRTGPLIGFCFIMMELCGESLEQWLKKEIPRDKIKSLKIFNQIIQGLDFIHNKNMVHGNIKPSNILFDTNNKDGDLRVRIADFGLAMHAVHFTTTCSSGLSLYAAPEIFRNKYDSKSDNYSAGLILFELLYNCAGEDHDEIISLVKENDFPEAFQKEMKFAVPTLKNILSFNLSSRPTSDQLLKILATDPDWNDELQLATSSTKRKSDFLQQESWKLESTCTSEEHKVHEMNTCSTEYTRSWNGEKGYSDWFTLPAVTNSTTKWEVYFGRWSNDDFAINVRCELNKQFCAASFRLFAKVEENPQVWTEEASVVKSGDVRECCFSKKICELNHNRPISIRVRVQWIELNEIPLATDLLEDGATCISCVWKLSGWKSVSPTADNWNMYSESFGRGGLLWRIVVSNRSANKGREFVIRVMLQHLPKSLVWSGLEMNYSLSLGDNALKDKKGSWCEWKILAALEPLNDSFDLNVKIRINSLKKPNLLSNRR